MGTPQDWAPYSSVDEAAKVYLRDPELALDQLRSVIDLPAIKIVHHVARLHRGVMG